MKPYQNFDKAFFIQVKTWNLSQPDLSGNPFLLNLTFNLSGNLMQKRLGAEGG